MPAILALLSLVLIAAAPAALAAQRTFVSTGGLDANTVNNCSLANPCRSFGGAMTVTDSNGEIVVLDSGGYGSVTVNKSVAIVAPSGVYAGISVFPGNNGVTINTPGVVVTLKGLTINGQGGNAGIDFQQGARLTVEGCEIANVGGSSTAGIFARAPGGTVVVRDTVIRETAYVAIWVKQETSGQATTLVADNVAVHNATFWAIYVGGTGHIGFAESYLTGVTITGSSSTAVVADSNVGGPTLVSVTKSTASGNGFGVISSGAAAKLIVASSTIARNAGPAMQQLSSGVLLSRGDNTVHDNNGGGAQTSGTIGSLTPL